MATNSPLLHLVILLLILSTAASEPAGAQIQGVVDHNGGRGGASGGGRRGAAYGRKPTGGVAGSGIFGAKPRRHKQRSSSSSHMPHLLLSVLFSCVAIFPLFV